MRSIELRVDTGRLSATGAEIREIRYFRPISVIWVGVGGSSIGVGRLVVVIQAVVIVVAILVVEVGGRVARNRP